MGYYTYFTLDVEPQKSLSPEEIVPLEEEIDKLCVFEGGDISCGYVGEAKWYDYQEDMRLLSARFPDVLFTLHGDGESGEDMWNTYFLSGRMQHCQAEIIYPDLDMDALLRSHQIEDDGTQRYSYQPSDSPIFQQLGHNLEVDELL